MPNFKGSCCLEGICLLLMKGLLLTGKGRGFWSERYINCIKLGPFFEFSAQQQQKPLILLKIFYFHLPCNLMLGHQFSTSLSAESKSY